MAPQQLALHHIIVPARRGTTASTRDNKTLLQGSSYDYWSQPEAFRDNFNLPILGPHSRVQQQLLGGTIQESKEVSVEVEYGDKVSDKNRGNGAGTSDDLQGSGSDGATLRVRELGSDEGNAEGSGGVPSFGGPEDIRDFKLASQGGRMGWAWSSVEEALNVEFVWPMKEYICRQHATIA